MSVFTDFINTKSKTTVWVDPLNVNLRKHGVFNSAANWIPFISPSSVYDERYGVGASNQKGNLVGERFNRDILMDAIKSGNLTGVPVDYFPTRVDEEDIKLVSYPQNSNVAFYDSVIVPAANVDPEPGPEPGPGPEPCPELHDIPGEVLDAVDVISKFRVGTIMGPGRVAQVKKIVA